MGFVNEILPNRNRQTIDRERGIVLRKKHGPGPDGEYDFELEMHGLKIEFSGTSGMKWSSIPDARKQGIYDFDWNFKIFSVPDSLRFKKSEVIPIIQEALKAWGDNYDENRANLVTVTFDPRVL